MPSLEERLARLEAALGLALPSPVGGGSGFHNQDVIAALLATNVPPNARIEIFYDANTGTNQILLYTGDANETNPAFIVASLSALFIGGPEFNSLTPASIFLDADLGAGSKLEMTMDQWSINAGADLLGAWPAFIPTLRNFARAPVNTTPVCAMFQIGKLLIAQAELTVTSNSAGNGLIITDIAGGQSTAKPNARCGIFTFFDSSANLENVGVAAAFGTSIFGVRDQSVAAAGLNTQLGVGDIIRYQVAMQVA